MRAKSEHRTQRAYGGLLSASWPMHLLSPPSGNITIMPARSYLIFGDIEGKLDVLCVECTKCARKGRYSVRGLIEKYGSKANMMKWKEQLNGDCPKRDAHGLHECCDLICPDLPTVLLKDSSA